MNSNCVSMILNKSSVKLVQMTRLLFIIPYFSIIFFNSLFLYSNSFFFFLLISITRDLSYSDCSSRIFENNYCNLVSKYYKYFGI
jgi:hypothetical protein